MRASIFPRLGLCLGLLSVAACNSTIDLDPVPAVGVQLTKVQLKPGKVTAVTKDGNRERPVVEIITEIAISKAQDPQTEVVAKLHCKVNDHTMVDEWGALPVSIAKAPGESVRYSGYLALDPSVFAPLDICQVSFGHIVRKRPGPMPFTALGELCLQNGKVTKGECPSGVLPRTAGGELPSVLDVEVSLGPAAPPGPSVAYPPGEPVPRYTLHLNHLLVRGSGDIPASGHRVDARCSTANGVVAKGIGYPTQAKDIGPGEVRTFDVNWHFADEPTSCQIEWSLGGGSLDATQNLGERTSFGMNCWASSKVTSGTCSPAIAAPATSASTAPAASSSAATPAASTRAAPGASAAPSALAP